MIRKYKVYTEPRHHGFIETSRIVKAFTAADAITQTLVHPGLRITKVEPVQEETKQKTNSKGKRCPWDEETKQKYDGKCAVCEWDNKCVKQVEETVDSCTWLYKGV